MGHRRIIGRVTEQAIGGSSFIRVDVPGKEEGFVATQFYSPSAVYCITPTVEEVARATADADVAAPISRFELPFLDEKMATQAEIDES
jgi:hypothetical protein